MRIGVFIGGVQFEYQRIILRQMTEYAHSNNVTLCVFSIFDAGIENVLFAEGEKHIFDLPNFDELDAVIVLGDTFQNFGMREYLVDRIEKEAHCPVVSLREYEEGYHNVLVDNEKAIYDVTSHFINHHKFTDICFVTGIIEMKDAQERFSGYKKAMAEAGLEVTDDMVYYGTYWRSYGKEMVDYFVSNRDKIPEAIVFSNDYMALAFNDEARERGIRIPQDVCISGFDDLDDAQLMKPALSSVTVQFEKMTVECLDRAIGLANGKIYEDKDFRVSAIPRFRESCGCNDPLVIRNKTIKMDYQRYRYMTQTCIYMITDFEVVMSERECVDTAGRIARELGAENIFVCLCEKGEDDEDGNKIIRQSFSDTVHLKLYYDEEGKAVDTDIPFSCLELLPKSVSHMLENKVNYILCIHSKTEVLGYVIIQLPNSLEVNLEERFAFLCMNLGIGLSRVDMYDEMTSMNDIKHMYLKDSMTDLYNRRGFDNEIAKLHRNLKNKECNIALVSVDMDGLKYINDNFGHVKGDEAIISFSECLNKVLEPDEFCARMGGDEFQVVLNLSQKDRIERFRNDLAQKLKAVNEKINKDYVVDASIGVCVVNNWDSLIESAKEADRLMYDEKKNKKNKQGNR